MKNTTKKENKKKDKKRVGLYLPAVLLEMLHTKAKKDDRSLNYTVVKLLENSLN